MKRRRQYLINDTFQSRFIAACFAYQLIIWLVFAGAIFVPVGVTLDEYSLSSPEFKEASRQFLVLHNRVWQPMIVAIALLTLHSVFFSHRIAGPLYRFRAVFRAVAKGNLNVSALIRKKDLLQKEAESLGEMVEFLRAGMTDLQTDVTAVKEELGRLEEIAGRSSDLVLAQVVAALRKRVEGLSEFARRFHAA